MDSRTSSAIRKPESEFGVICGDSQYPHDRRQLKLDLTLRLSRGIRRRPEKGLLSDDSTSLFLSRDLDALNKRSVCSSGGSKTPLTILHPPSTPLTTSDLFIGPSLSSSLFLPLNSSHRFERVLDLLKSLKRSTGRIRKVNLETGHIIFHSPERLSEVLDVDDSLTSFIES